ncbi:unnamed protein product [Coffea canephora]|uniref:CYTH domain-containing protein n=1 Tax=Coffea canephora TaxID=49390 RepID=A0A068UPX4_COFCA|nr:unnamed protein product [Coffea canephora]
MLRRKATKIEVKLDDKEELEESRTSNLWAGHILRRITTSFAKQMEVEVKLRLPDSAAHRKVLSLLSPFHTKTHHQRNSFYDGAAGELSSRRAVLRLRFYENSQPLKCFICLKAKAVIVDGVSRVEEDEEEVDFEVGLQCLEDATKLVDVDSRVARRAREEFGVKAGFVGLGGFRNVRNVYERMRLSTHIRRCQSLRLFGLESCLSNYCHVGGCLLIPVKKQKVDAAINQAF